MNKYFTLFIGVQLFFISCKDQGVSNLKRIQKGSELDSTKAQSTLPFEKVGNFSINLTNNEGKCILAYNRENVSEKIPTLVTWPANFHRDTQGKIRLVKQYEILYFLVEKSSPDTIRQNSCITHVQAFKVFDDKIIGSANESVLAACPPFQWDDYLFYSLFDKK